MAQIPKPRVFFDADVLLAGAASTTGACRILLRLCELTLMDGFTSQQAVTEAERNIQVKAPQALSAFQSLVASAVQVVPDPDPEALTKFDGRANTEDTPILAAAVQSGCHYLATFNTRHYCPPIGTITVIRPGDLLLRIRQQLLMLVPLEILSPPELCGPDYDGELPWPKGE